MIREYPNVRILVGFSRIPGHGNLVMSVDGFEGEDICDMLGVFGGPPRWLRKPFLAVWEGKIVVDDSGIHGFDNGRRVGRYGYKFDGEWIRIGLERPL